MSHLEKMNFHWDYWDVLSSCTKDERMRLVDALLVYYFEGEEPTDLKGLEMALFKSLRGKVLASKTGLENAMRRKLSQTSQAPSDAPSDAPTQAPSEGATQAPSEGATQAPSEGATQAPSEGASGQERSKKKEEVLERDRARAGACACGGRYDSTSPGFVEPTVSQVEAEAQARGCGNVDAQAFVDYYAAQGWMRGNGQPVTDWRRLLTGWRDRQAERDARCPRKGVTADEFAAYNFG